MVQMEFEQSEINGRSAGSNCDPASTMLDFMTVVIGTMQVRIFDWTLFQMVHFYLPQIVISVMTTIKNENNNQNNNNQTKQPQNNWMWPHRN